MEIRNFTLEGYQNYAKIENKISALLEEIYADKYLPLMIAINETVLNAAKYHINGFEKANITILFRIFTNELRVSIKSNTKTFDAFSYQNKLKKILENEKDVMIEWGDYIGDRDVGRGFWYILSAVDYLFMDEFGDEITLVIRKTKSDLPEVNSLYYLIPKFLVMRNGVIY